MASAPESIFATLWRLREAQSTHSTAGELLFETSRGFERAVLNRAAQHQGTLYQMYETPDTRFLGHFVWTHGELDVARIDEGFARVRQKYEEANAAYKALLDDTAAQIRDGGAVDRWRHVNSTPVTHNVDIS